MHSGETSLSVRGFLFVRFKPVERVSLEAADFFFFFLTDSFASISLFSKSKCWPKFRSATPIRRRRGENMLGEMWGCGWRSSGSSSGRAPSMK